jgi:hypothetical protein
MKKIRIKLNATILAVFFALPVSSSAAESMLKFPMSIPIDKSENLYIKFSDSKILAKCIAIKVKQYSKGERAEEFMSSLLEYYYPKHKKISDNGQKIKKICGTNNACYKKHISESDLAYTTAFAQVTKFLDSENTSLPDLGMMAFASCGKIIQK